MDSDVFSSRFDWSFDELRSKLALCLFASDDRIQILAGDADNPELRRLLLNVSPPLPCWLVDRLIVLVGCMNVTGNTQLAIWRHSGHEYSSVEPLVNKWSFNHNHNNRGKYKTRQKSQTYIQRLLVWIVAVKVQIVSTHLSINATFPANVNRVFTWFL